MSKIQFQYDIQNLTPANAQPVEANFTKVEQHINQEVVERDGTVAMRAQLKLVGDPVSALDAAPKQYVDQVIPVGLIMMWGAAAAPANGKWLLCDGAPLQTATYPELFAVIGYAWGGAGGSFNTPNLSGRMPVGVSGAHPLGQTGGSEGSALPAHVHSASHKHNYASTGVEDADHVHFVPGDSGGADRDLGTSNDGGHTHSPGAPGLNFIGNGGTGEAAVRADSDGYTFFHDTTNNGAHTHTVTNHNHHLNLNTQGVSANHHHGMDVPSWDGNTSQTGVDASTLNMPPFLAVPFIIRCR